MAKKTKTYRGHSAEFNGCGCYFCSGSKKIDNIDKATKNRKIVNIDVTHLCYAEFKSKNLQIEYL